MSNCANSGIDVVGVLTQYESVQLNSYVAQSQRWGLDVQGSGIFVLPPREKIEGFGLYKGTADAITQNIDFIDLHEPEYVLILSGDHIYKMNYDKLLDSHIQNNADATIAVIEVPIKEASRFGIMNTDENYRIEEFEEKPANPKSNLASMGIYIFTWKSLKNTCRMMTSPKPLLMISATTSFQNIWQMANASTHIHSAVTGRTWVLSTVSGNPTWT